MIKSYKFFGSSLSRFATRLCEANQNSFGISVMNGNVRRIKRKPSPKCEEERSNLFIESLKHNIKIHFKSHYTVIRIIAVFHIIIAFLPFCSSTIKSMNTKQRRREIQTNRNFSRYTKEQNEIFLRRGKESKSIVLGESL